MSFSFQTSFLDPQLNYFLQCLPEKTLLAASRKIGITQPALSRSLDSLEDRLGFKVFERSRYGIQLTPRGQALLEKVQKISSDLSNSIESVKLQESYIGGEIKIGGHPSILQDFFIPIYSQLSKQFPFIQFRIITKSSLEVLDEVGRNLIDFGLVINPIEQSHFIVRNITQTRAHIYFAEDLQNHKRCFANPDMVDLARLTKVFQKKKLVPRFEFIGDYDLIANLVAKNEGFGLLPSHVADRFQLKIHSQLSAKLNMNYQLKLVAKASQMSDSKRQFLRAFEAALSLFVS